jgi:hypothetical protein
MATYNITITETNNDIQATLSGDMHQHTTGFFVVQGLMRLIGDLLLPSIEAAETLASTCTCPQCTAARANQSKSAPSRNLH